ILYEILTRRRPFKASSLYELLRQQVEAEPAPPATLRQDLPAQLQAIVGRSLAKDPAQRFQSAWEFAHALEMGTPVGSRAERLGQPNADQGRESRDWSAPSLATAIRAPSAPHVVGAATPGSYAHDQSIARSAKSR